MADLTIPPEAATARQLAVAIYRGVERLELAVSDLSVKVTELEAEVDAVRVRVDEALTDLPVLQAALAAAQQAAADLAAVEAAEDVAQNQALTDANANLTAALDDAVAAASRIEAQTAELRTVAPETPAP